MYITLLFSSATAAYKARRALADADIPSSVRKLSSGKVGCTFALLLPKSSFLRARSLLAKEHIDYEFHHDEG